MPDDGDRPSGQSARRASGDELNAPDPGRDYVFAPSRVCVVRV